MPESLQDTQLQTEQFTFHGQWLPDQNSALIGAKNFRRLQNLRYTDTSIEGVRGYSKINATALANAKIKNGVQLVTDRDVPSWVLVQAEDGSGGNKIFANKTAIPDAGEFEAAALYTEATGAGLARFSEAPGGSIALCDGKESLIWAGEEMRAAAFYTVDDATGANPKDYSEAVNNTLSTTGHFAPIGAQRFFLALSTRPLKGINVKLRTANPTTSTLTAKVWTGAAFSAVSSVVDGTTIGGKSLAQDGKVCFDSTVGTAKPYHFQGLYLYAYLFELSAGSAEIYNVSLDAPMQPMVDIWDGVYREPVAFQASRSGNYEDFTAEVNYESNIYDPIAAKIGGLVSTDHVIVMFEERMSAIKFKMIAGKVNATAATATLKYWDGSAWQAVTGLTDGTAASGKSLNQSGTISWQAPDEGSEFPTTLFGVTGWAYQLSWSATLTAGTGNDGTQADLVTGIPTQKPVRAYRFPAMFNNRLMLCGYVAGHEGNRVDYSMPNAADVFNGELSSQDGKQSLFFGGTTDIVAGCQLYNRFGSNIFSVFLVLKRGETYLLNGENPENFVIYPIDMGTGCVAPLTVATGQIGFGEGADGVTRNVAIWLSHAGPVMFDGAVLMPLRGIDLYFKPGESQVNFAAIENARGWHDSANREYNLLLPVGEGVTECNTWLVYDLQRKRWFEKVPPAGKYPQSGFQVMDLDGVRYVYAGRNDGYLMRLDDGASWDGEALTQICETGDFWPTSNLWDETRIRRVKLVAKAITEEGHIVRVSHMANAIVTGLDVAFADTEDDEWTNTEDDAYVRDITPALDLSLAAEGAEMVQAVTACDYLGRTHRFRFEVSTMSQHKAFQPIGWALEHRRERTGV